MEGLMQQLQISVDEIKNGVATINGQLTTIKKEMTTMQHEITSLKDKITHKNHHKHWRRERFKHLNESSSSDVSIFSIKSEDMPPPDIDVHKEVLRDEHRRLMNTIDLNNTNILDHLVQENAFVSSEVESIRTTNPRRCQNREFLFKLQAKDKKSFSVFVQSLAEPYPDLYQSINNAYISTLQEEIQHPVSCVVCRIKENVDVNDVIDTFYEHRIIDASEAKLIEKCVKNDMRWSQLMSYMKRIPESVNITGLLVDALDEKHKSLSIELSKFIHRPLSCFCKSLRLHILHRDNSIRNSENFPEYLNPNRESLSSSSISREGSLSNTEPRPRTPVEDTETDTSECLYTHDRNDMSQNGILVHGNNRNAVLLSNTEDENPYDNAPSCSIDRHSDSRNAVIRRTSEER